MSSVMIQFIHHANVFVLTSTHYSVK
uniref:Uncharacterized protein n=1 Tax=Anguilla anguilla TaxID=7936 RepID=A0A0E9XV04_ANGAN